MVEVASLLSCQLVTKYILIKVIVFQGAKLLKHLIHQIVYSDYCFIMLYIVLLKGSHGNFAMFPWQPHTLVYNVITPLFTA